MPAKRRAPTWCGLGLQRPSTSVVGNWRSIHSRGDPRRLSGNHRTRHTSYRLPGASLQIRTRSQTKRMAIQNKLWNYSHLFCFLVRERGLEPPRVTPLPPQSSASTNSATHAKCSKCKMVGDEGFEPPTSSV